MSAKPCGLVDFAQVKRDPAGGCQVILYSFSMYGYAAPGANAAWVRHWSGAVGTKAAEAHS